jgi:hypothetical protein
MLKGILAVVGVIVLGGAGLVVWRVWATHRGSEDVYQQLASRILPVEQRLNAGQDPERDIKAFVDLRGS